MHNALDVEAEEVELDSEVETEHGELFLKIIGKVRRVTKVID